VEILVRIIHSPSLLSFGEVRGSLEGEKNLCIWSLGNEKRFGFVDITSLYFHNYYLYVFEPRYFYK
jgi:hypothetical protein